MAMTTSLWEASSLSLIMTGINVSKSKTDKTAGR